MAENSLGTVGSRLRRCRQNCGFSQRQVADALKVSRSTYTYYENGRFEPSLQTIVKLAHIFCVDVAELLPGETLASNLHDLEEEPINPIYTLTKDEQELLLAYRLLKDEDKSDILAKITNMPKRAI